MRTDSKTALAKREDALERARKKKDAVKAENTKSAYKSDFELFVKWCASNCVTSLPVSPENLGMYISELDELGRKPATISRALHAIKFMHKKAELHSPVDDNVKEILTGIRNMRGMKQLKAAPITLEKLRRILAIIPSDFLGYRDKALFLIGWSGAFRRSELVGLKLDDIEDANEGIVLRLRKSKTDQSGKGRPVPIPFIQDTTVCPVRALRRWLDVAGIKDGFLFRSVGPGGHKLIYEALERPLTPRTVSLIIKRHVKKADFDPTKYSGHSLRSGFITSASSFGARDKAIMNITGHTSAAQMQDYIREGRLFVNHPLYTIFDSPVITDMDQPIDVRQKVEDRAPSTE